MTQEHGRWILLGLALLFALPASAADDEEGGEPVRTRVLVLDFTTAGSSEEVARTVTQIVTAELSRRSDRFDVLATADLRRAIALEGERQAIGCDEESCLAEIAGAMGADLVVFGEVGRIENTTVISLNVFDASAARSRARTYAEVAAGQSMSDGVRGAVTQLLGELEAPGVKTAEGGASAPLLVAGGATAGASALVLGGAALTAWAAQGVRADPDSLGKDKDAAAVVQLSSGAVAMVAITGVLVGAGLSGAALFME